MDIQVVIQNFHKRCLIYLADIAHLDFYEVVVFEIGILSMCALHKYRYI